MKRIIALLLLVVFVAMMGCSANVHTIGNGAQGNEVVQARQWYILFGAVPLNEVNTNEMAGDVADYEIKTEQSAADILMNIFTSYVTVYSRTVTVTK